MITTLMIAIIRVEPGWAVGAVTLSDPTIDRDILLDAVGQPWIPGSALAGSLRAHLAQAVPPVDIRLMGSRPPRDRGESARSTVSPLWIVGATFTAAPAADTITASSGLEVVGQTAINRTTGAATAGSLRISRIAAAGGELRVFLRHDSAPHPLETADLQLIARWQPAIGRDRTKGSGRAQLIELRHGTVDPATPDGAAVWLTHTGPTLFDAVAKDTIASTADGTPWLEEEFQIVDGMLVGTASTERTATSRKRLGRPLLPGSAWKGIVRSRAEFIIRSRYGKGAACQEQTGCGKCVACAVFGHQAQRSKLAFRDSYVETAGADTAEQEPQRTQVAIDRVTGGAHEALLFQIAPVTTGRLTLRIDALGTVDPWVRNLIRHVVRDIHDGLIGVGSRSTRGLGTLRLIRESGELEPVVIPFLQAAAGPDVMT